MSVAFVTGGAGYVGSHTVQALAAAGYDVVIYDNLSAGHIEAVERLAAAFPHRSITFVRGDIGDANAVARALAESGAKAVLHFAARLSVGDSVRDPAGYYRTNVIGTMTLLGAVAEAGIKHFIFSSTCATFGEPQTPSIDERHPQQPVNAYGETKLAVERALPHFDRAYGLRSVALRYFNAAGADPGGLIGEDHQPEEHLIPRAIGAAQGGQPLVVFGSDYPTPDGTCVRDYVHVCDLASAHLAALAALESGAASAFYNVGSEHGASVREVLESVARATGKSVPFEMGARRAGDPARLVASSARVKRELEWTPRFDDLDAIVATAWEWARRHPHGYRAPTT